MRSKFCLLLTLLAALTAIFSTTAVAESVLQQQQPVSAVATISGFLKLPNAQNIRLVSQMQPRPLATITLHNPSLTIRTSARVDGFFAFHQVPEGVYMLTAEFAHLVFPTIRVSVIPARNGALRIRALVNDGTQAIIDADGTATSPINVVALGRHSYFVPREEVSVFSFLKNPMIIMMLVSVGMMGLMKLVPQDELRKQMKDMNDQVQQSKETLGLEKKSS